MISASKDSSKLNSNSVPGVFYNELQTNQDYTVDDSYYKYLTSSLNYRSDLVRIIARLQQLFMALTHKTTWINVIDESISENYYWMYKKSKSNQFRWVKYTIYMDWSYL